MGHHRLSELLKGDYTFLKENMYYVPKAWSFEDTSGVQISHNKLFYVV